MKKRIILLLAITGFGAAAKDTERVPAADGVTIVRDFYDDDSLKTVSRLDRDGILLGTLYYAAKGIPLHLDYFDAEKRVTKSVLYDADGVPNRQQYFDDKGTIVFVETFTYAEGKAAEGHPPKSVRRQFVTPAGKISFAVDGAWDVIAQQFKLPIATVAFQIQNTADQNTPDSTNIAFSLYDASSATAKKTLEDSIGNRAIGPLKKSMYGEWARWTYSGKQGDTPYTICDATRKLAGVIVAVRLAWPQLPKNPADYDTTMEKTLLSVLDSVARDK